MMVSLFLVPAKLLLETFDTNKQSSLSRSKYNANYKSWCDFENQILFVSVFNQHAFGSDSFAGCWIHGKDSF